MLCQLTLWRSQWSWATRSPVQGWTWPLAQLDCWAFAPCAVGCSSRDWLAGSYWPRFSSATRCSPRPSLQVARSPWWISCQRQKSDSVFVCLRSHLTHSCLYVGPCWSCFHDSESQAATLCSPVGRYTHTHTQYMKKPQLVSVILKTSLSFCEITLQICDFVSRISAPFVLYLQRFSH